MMTTSSFNFCIFVLCTFLLFPTCCQGVPGNRIALFIFGDSLFDAGNNNYLTNPIGQANFRPYGDSFFRHPTGRSTDGRIIPDFIAEYLELPFLPPYLQPGNKDFRVGVNFASGGAGALVETYQGRVVELLTQLKYFKNVEKQLRKKLGSAEKKALLSKAVYMFSIGGNDYFPFVANENSSMLQFYSKKEYVSMVIGNLTTVLRGIYQSGGRKFVTMTVPPLGRLPSVRASNHGNMTSQLTELAKLHNKALPKALKELHKELKGFKYVNFDYYSVLGNIISHPTKYGFRNAIEGCCGSGLYRGLLNCGKDGYELCEDVAGHVFFDASHPSQNVYKQSAELMWSGSSDVVKPYNLRKLIKI